jgi:hypothetical protein
VSPLIDTWITDAVARLNSIPWFDDIAILSMDQGNPVEEATNALGALTPKAGKVGAAVLVQQVDYDGALPNLPVAEIRPQFSIVVMEDPLINRTAFNASGTGKTAGMIELAVIDAFHHFRCDGLHDTLVFDGSNDVDISSISATARAREVKFTGRLSDRNVQLKCNTPRITASNAVVPATITITAAADFWSNGVQAYAPEIYYTTDGTYPRSGNGTLYTAPFDVPNTSAAVIRACAYRAGWLPSNVPRLDLDLTVEGTDDGNFVGTDGGELNPLG